MKNKPTDITPRISSAVRSRVDRFRDELEQTVESWLEDNRKETFSDAHFEDAIVSSIEAWGDE